MKKLGKIARSIIPYDMREKLRILFFKHFRTIGILNLFSSLGLLTYRKYIQVNHENVEVVFAEFKKNLKYQKFSEENHIKPAYYIKEPSLELQPFTATTKTVLLDIQNKNGFSFRNNHLLDKELNVLGENRTTELDERLPLPIYSQVLHTPIKLKGTVAYLSDPDPANYYHWMCRTLPLLRFYQKLLNFQEIDYFYVGKFPLKNFHKETLEAAGISMNRVIQEACTADRLLMAITNRSICFDNQINDPINKESFLFSRYLFADIIENSSKKNRLYIQRGNVSRRKLINETEVIGLLEKYGFQAVSMDNKTVQQQADLFSSAEAIVALHGAALTNLLFAKPGVKVIELASYGYVNNCFYTMASYAEADYLYLQGEKIEQNTNDLRNLDTLINIPELEDILLRASLNQVSSFTFE
jgi:hypothetical protein